MAKVKKDFDAGRRTLSSLPVGTFVAIQDRKTKRWSMRGTILEKKKNRNTYTVESVNGRRYLRNRKFLRPCLNQDFSDIKAEQPKKESDHHISDFVCDNLAEQPKKENLRRSKRKCVKKDLKVRFNFKKRTFV